MEYLDIDTLVNNAVERHQVAATLNFFVNLTGVISWRVCFL